MTKNMKLNIRAFGIAQAAIAAILFIICSLLVNFLPEMATSLARYIFHADLSGIMRPVSIGDFIIGLLLFSIGFGLLSLVAASIYNCLAKDAVGISPPRGQ